MLIPSFSYCFAFTKNSQIYAHQTMVPLKHKTMSMWIILHITSVVFSRGSRRTRHSKCFQPLDHSLDVRIQSELLCAMSHIYQPLSLVSAKKKKKKADPQPPSLSPSLTMPALPPPVPSSPSPLMWWSGGQAPTAPPDRGASVRRDGVLGLRRSASRVTCRWPSPKLLNFILPCSFPSSAYDDKFMHVARRYDLISVCL